MQLSSLYEWVGALLEMHDQSDDVSVRRRLLREAKAVLELNPQHYKAKPLLSANELEFLSRLESAVPELRFCPQVAMGALLDPAVSKKDNPRRHASLRGTFAQKMIDFVAMDRKTGAIVAIIELDDRTHNEDKDAKRDAMLKSAGYKTVRWHSKNKPDAAAIRAELILAA